MDYLNIEVVAAKWGISTRRLQFLCSEGKVSGARRFGRAWMIPKDAIKPLDGRSKAARAAITQQQHSIPFPRHSPSLCMTDLYHSPGCSKRTEIELADQPDIQTLFAAEIAYCRGFVDEAYAKACTLLDHSSDFYTRISAGLLLAQCAVWLGDLTVWNNGKAIVCDAHTLNQTQQEMKALSICAADVFLSDLHSIPQWFQEGCFELLHQDSLPFANTHYSMYLYAKGQSLIAQSYSSESITGLAILKLLPCILEPMISQAIADRTVIAEIYLRLTCAVAYHFCKKDEKAIYHIDKVIALSMPDNLFGILATYCLSLSTLIEQRIKLIDASVWDEVSRLFDLYVTNSCRLKCQIESNRKTGILI